MVFLSYRSGHLLNFWRGDLSELPTDIRDTAAQLGCTHREGRQWLKNKQWGFIVSTKYSIPWSPTSNRISYTGEPTHAVFDEVICGGGPWRRVRAVAKAGIFAPLRRWQVTENKMKWGFVSLPNIHTGLGSILDTVSKDTALSSIYYLYLGYIFSQILLMVSVPISI